MRTETKYGTTYRYPESIEELVGRIISYDYQEGYLEWETVYYQIYGVDKVKDGYNLRGVLLETIDDVRLKDFDGNAAVFTFIPEDFMTNLLGRLKCSGKRDYGRHGLAKEWTYWELFYGTAEEFLDLYENI